MSDEPTHEINQSTPSETNQNEHPQQLTEQSNNEISLDKVIHFVNSGDLTTIFANLIINTDDNPKFDEYDSLLSDLHAIQIFDIPPEQFELPNTTPLEREIVNIQNPSHVIDDAMKTYNDPIIPNILGKTIEVVEPETYLKDVEIENKNKKNYDLTTIFNFTDFPDFNESDLISAKKPLNPLFDDLTEEISKLVQLRKENISAEEGSRLALIISSIFLNGIQPNKKFISAVEDLVTYFPSLESVYSEVKRFEKPSYQGQIFTNYLLNRNLLKLTVDAIQTHEDFIENYYLPSAFLRYSDTLNRFSAQIEHLSSLKFSLNISAVDDEYLTFYLHNPAFEFVDIVDTGDVVQLIVTMLNGWNKKKLFKPLIGNDSYKFIDEIYTTRKKQKEKSLKNTKGEPEKAMKNKYLNMFLIDFQKVQGNQYFDTVFKQDEKLLEFFRLGLNKKILDVYFLMLVVHQNIAAKYFEPSSIITDLYRAKYIASFLAFKMEKSGRAPIVLDDDQDNNEMAKWHEDEVIDLPEVNNNDQTENDANQPHQGSHTNNTVVINQLFVKSHSSTPRHSTDNSQSRTPPPSSESSTSNNKDENPEKVHE